MKIEDLKGRRVTVMGVGLNEGGVGTIKFLVKAGSRVTATDLKTRQILKPSLAKLKGLPVKYVLGRHLKRDFINADLIIKNPAVTDKSFYLQLAKKHKIPVETDLGIFYSLISADQPLVAITGTKGKTTTATLIHYFLKTAKKDAVLAGNLKISVFDVYPKIKKNTVIVLEVSSQQLEGLLDINFKPKVAVLTNIFNDHLDRYHNISNYSRVKSIIFKKQSAGDYLVLNKDDMILRSFSKLARSQIYTFSLKGQKHKRYRGTYIKNQAVYFRDHAKTDQIVSLKDIRLLGKHNIANVLAAINVAIIFGIPRNTIVRAIKTFTNVAHRLDLVRTFKGIEYYNDTAATNPSATLAALQCFSKPIILILGGRNKQLDFRELISFISKFRKIKQIILLRHRQYDASLILKSGLTKTKVLNKVQEADSLKQAVILASKMAQKGDLVLLSPAAASFGMFQNEFERGDKFVRAIKDLK